MNQFPNPANVKNYNGSDFLSFVSQSHNPSTTLIQKSLAGPLVNPSSLRTVIHTSRNEYILSSSQGSHDLCHEFINPIVKSGIRTNPLLIARLLNSINCNPLNLCSFDEFGESFAVSIQSLLNKTNFDIGTSKYLIPKHAFLHLSPIKDFARILTKLVRLNIEFTKSKNELVTFIQDTAFEYLFSIEHMRKLLINIEDKELFFQDLRSFYSFLVILKRVNKRVPNPAISALLNYNRVDFDYTMLCNGSNEREFKESIAQELVTYFALPEVINVLINDTSIVYVYLNEANVSCNLALDLHNYLTSNKSNPLLARIMECYNQVFNVSIDQLVGRLMDISVLLHDVLICQRDWSLRTDDIYELSSFKLLSDLTFYYQLSKLALKTPEYLDANVNCIDSTIDINQLIQEYNSVLNVKIVKHFESNFLLTVFNIYEDPELYDYLSKLYLEFSFEM
jgi:hypothetical protein